MMPRFSAYSLGDLMSPANKFYDPLSIRPATRDKSKIGLVDTTLRDAQQCLWTTRMTAGMMAPIADKMDQAGFDQIDFMAPVQFDVCVRYLREDPWEKARYFREKFTKTPLRGYCRSKSLLGFAMVPDDIVELWIERLCANGFSVVGTLDALFDVDNMVISLRRAKALGMRAIGALVFCESELHTDDLYARTTKALVEQADIDGIMIKDSGALLTPDRIRTLIPALRKVLGNRSLELHSHCSTGMGPMVYMEAAKLGIDQLHTSIAPLAGGPAQPSVQQTMSNLSQLGFRTDGDSIAIDEISDYLTELAAQEQFPLGGPGEYDVFHYKHQMPGGMLANWRFQLRQAGQEHRFDEILEEIVQIRRELAWPIMVTPFSQIIAVQAMLNVVSGERYSSVPDEVKMYALEHFGKHLAPIDPDALDRIVANGSSKIPLKPVPLEPALPDLRRRYPRASDDERLLRFMFPGNDVDETIRAGSLSTDFSLSTPMDRLLSALPQRSRLTAFSIAKGGDKLAWQPK